MRMNASLTLAVVFLAGPTWADEVDAKLDAVAQVLQHPVEQVGVEGEVGVGVESVGLAHQHAGADEQIAEAGAGPAYVVVGPGDDALAREAVGCIPPSRRGLTPHRRNPFASPAHQLLS